MRKLLLQLDTSPHPSVFDRVVAYDGGADEIMSYGGVTEDTVRDLVHGAIFTRGPKDLHNTAIFIGGTDMAAGERLLKAVQETFFGPMRVSVMLDSNGSNTTAVAAVVKLQQARRRRRAGARSSPPAPVRSACARPACSRRPAPTSPSPRARPKAAPSSSSDIKQRFGGDGASRSRWPTRRRRPAVLEGCELLLSAGGSASSWSRATRGRDAPGCVAAADLNAVPPLGIEGIEATDNGVERDGVKTYGALGVGGLKMKIHKACIARLFERNDLVLDAETILEVARRA